MPVLFIANVDGGDALSSPLCGTVTFLQEFLRHSACCTGAYVPFVSLDPVAPTHQARCHYWGSACATSSLDEFLIFSRMEIPPSGVLVRSTKWNVYPSLLLRHRRAIEDIPLLCTHLHSTLCPCWQDCHYSKLVFSRLSQSCCT